MKDSLLVTISLNEHNSTRSESFPVSSMYNVHIELEDAEGNIVTNTYKIVSSSLEIPLTVGIYKINKCDVYVDGVKLYRLSNTARNRYYKIAVQNPNITIPIVRLSSFSFDWENAVTVSDDPNLPILPWISGASTGVPRKISSDNKKVDGWVLLHNNFNLTDDIKPEKKYLLFYNKYSGILRMWYYHEGSSNYSALKYSIQTTSNSSILNFNYDFAKAMDVKKPSYTEYLSGDNNIPGSVGLTDKTWYMFDFEIAYDEDVDNITLDQSDLFISARGINYSTLELSGSQTGKIAGNILLNSSSGTSLFNISNLVFNVGGKNNTIPNDTQTDVRTNDGNEWFNKIKESIENRFVTTVSDAVTKLASAGLNILTSPVGNFLNSLVHRGLSNNQASVDLSFATKVSIDGTLTSDQSVSSINLHMPGMMEDAGLVYIYDEPLGVFNLEKTPVVYYEQTYYLNDPDGARYYQYFNIDYSSINFKINPSILKDITNINKKLI